VNGAELRAAMASGRSVWGTMIVYARSLGAARVYGQLGFDYVIVDSEHSPNARSELADMSAALLTAGVCPIVRVPHTQPHETVMALDAGFHGVLVPYCETADQVSAVVSAARLRPLKGGLEVRARGTGQFPSDATREYLERRNQNVVVIIGIESVPAVQNLESILDVPGIDAIFIGPNDLSVSLGVPDQYDHPRYLEAVEHVIETAQGRGIPAGPHCFDETMLLQYREKGARFMLFSADVRALADGYRSTLNKARDLVAPTARLTL
jgi:staphyloferrin B biosynthesis citrate synthase